MMLDHALTYAARGWRVIPLHSMRGAACSCGSPAGAGHKDAGKHPRIRKAPEGWGSADPVQIRQWWGRWPDANIGIATGKVVVLDLDDRDGPCMAELRAMVEAHGPLPSTSVAATGRGSHIYFAGDMPGSKIVGSILVRGDGSYVVAPPSNHKSGRLYTWLAQGALAQWPEWLRQHIEVTGGHAKPSAERPAFFGIEPPSYLKQRVRGRIAESSTDEDRWSPELEAEIRSALQAFPSSCKRKPWCNVGMILKDLRWFRPDGTDIGREMWEGWSALCPEKYTPEDVAVRWNSFSRKPVADPVRLPTLFKYAREAGWTGDPADAGQAPAGSPRVSGVNGVHALPHGLTGVVGTPIHWVDLDEHKKPRPTCTNAGIAIEALGVSCRKDTFHEKMLVGGHAIQAWAGDLSDDAVHMLRKVIKRQYKFDPGEKNARDAAIQLCLENQFNPVVEYLAHVQAGWDQRSRVASWVVDYLGAANTALNREIGRLMLIAAARRARQPGCKFDQIIVLEGEEGTGKSSAIKILAGEDNFSDQHILGASDKEQQEAACGVWLHEIAELAGMRRTDVERTKQFASRTEDRARPAYGRLRVDMKRRGILIATTNEESYLKSETGNRRFWPIDTGRIDLEGLKRDRDQIWGEAARQEAIGTHLVLDPKLWEVARESQRDRLEPDSWQEFVEIAIEGKADCSLFEVLRGTGFLFSADQISQIAQNRVARILSKMGWIKYRKRQGARLTWRYRLAD